MTPEERTVMTTLVQQLQDEKDQQKFLQLVKDLNELLERKQHRLAATPTLCRICGKPVSLETAKANHEGKAVHEDCYVAAISKKEPSQN